MDTLHTYYSAGHHCVVEEVDLGTGLVRTRVTSNTSLTYSPPSFHSPGLPPDLADPFEAATVAVRPSGVAGAGAGLFTVRGVGAGQLISFYSGLVNLCAAAEATIKLDRRLEVTLANTNRQEGPVCISTRVCNN